MPSTASMDEEEPQAIDQGIGTGTVSRSFDAESWMFTQHKNYHLQLVQRKEAPIYRSSIPATTLQRLAYFRNFVSYIGKTHIFSMQTMDVNSFLWSAFITAVFKSFPSNFRVLFLSSFSPEEHCYVSKMVPFFYGVTLQIIVAAIADLIMSTETLFLLLEYLVFGIYERNPWNRCKDKTIKYKNRTLHCYTFDDFVLKYSNSSLGIKDTMYTETVNDTKHFVQIAPLIYYNKSRYHLSKYMVGSHFLIYAALIWLAAITTNRQIFKKYIWKVLELTHNAVIFIYFCTSLYLLSVYVEEDWTPMDIPEYVTRVSNAIQFVDFVFLAEAIVAPPIVHIVSARSSSQIEPGTDSGILTMSNTIFLVLRGLLTFNLKVYCQRVLGQPIVGSTFNRYPYFVLWPIFFTQVRFGSVILLIYFSVHFLADLLTFIITFQLLVEMTVCEWVFLKRWMVGVALGLLGFILNILSNTTQRIIYYIYIKSIMIITEIVVVNFLYPLERLIDDITFHYGHPPTCTRRWSLRLVPYFYAIKMYLLLRGFHNIFQMNYNYSTYKLSSILICTVPIVIGMLYSMYKFLIIMKQNWRVLFRPRPNWGPREHITRQLRKQYDAREHIISMGSRYLSRHLMAKSGMKTYRLDIYYETGRRSTASVLTGTLNFKE